MWCPRDAANVRGLADYQGVDVADATPERWLPIPGYEGFYEVSDHGRVRSLDRVIWRSNGTTQPRRGKELRPGRSAAGHRFVILCGRDGRKSNQWVHRLVLLAFVGPCPPGKVCCHRDDDPDNNRLSNLRWDTRSSNVHDAVRNGRNHYASRTHCSRNHPLEAPNLRQSELQSRNSRRCLACARAETLVRGRARAGLVRAADVDMQTLADLYYAEITATSGRRLRSGRKSHITSLPLKP